MELEQYNSDSFVVYVDAEVVYDGRASSTLERGNYLVIKKADGSVAVHGAVNIPAINYMSGGGVVTISDGMITVARRSELLKIKVHRVLTGLLPTDWSNNRVTITKTEAELTAILASDPARFFGAGEYHAHREYQTPVGPVDLILVSDRVFVVEVKRKKVTLKDCYQVRRYVDALDKGANFPGTELLPCVAGPDISHNALEHCEANAIRFLQVGWE